jgi:hypothetical protein
MIAGPGNGRADPSRRGFQPETLASAMRDERAMLPICGKNAGTAR